jgi:hypothetical protein
MRPKNGSDTWARTRDKLINSQLLYQLSYVGIKFISKNNNIISLFLFENNRIEN